jgi:predicted ATPase/class 3 adenylate cyclase
VRDLPRGTVTLLFTDIEGSTRLLHELGDAYADVLAEHRRVLRDAFAHHGGVEVDTQGDAFFYAFARAPDAVAAAAAAQESLGDGPVRVRIGVHTGEPVVTHEGYVGIDVHRAARIMSAGHGGQVVLSERTRAQLDGDAILTDLGLHRLKDLGRPEKLFQLGDTDFPPLKTLAATNLPVAASPLLGREREMAELLPLLQDGTKLLTITGPGGTGKTRLALQVAAELVGSLADGVFWVPLAGLNDAGLVLPTVGQTIGATGDLTEHLRDKELLLLLDNAEHVLAAAPELAELLTLSPRLRLLVTSRAPLHVSAEKEYPLDPLQTTDAATLFVERARAAGLDLDADSTVEAICRRLDGLPLAVELAAARAKLLDPAMLLGRLERVLPLLTGGARDAPERQRTLRATIEWSYDLLDDDGKRLFGALSVFAGSFSLGAAEEICDADVDTLAALVDFSLLKPMGDSRFLMLETLKEYAGERAEELGGTHELRRAHATWMLDIAEAAARDLLAGQSQGNWMTLLEQEHDNLRKAFDWLHDSGEHSRELRLAVTLAAFWHGRGHLREGLRRLRQAAACLPQASEDRLTALRRAAMIANELREDAEACRLADEALEVARAIGDRRSEALAFFTLGYVLTEVDPEAARRDYETALELAGDEDPSLTDHILNNLAVVASVQGRYDEAVLLFEECVVRARALSDRGGEGLTLSSLAWNLILQARAAGEIPDLNRVLDCFLDSLRANLDSGQHGQLAFALSGLGTARAQTDAAHAVLFLAAATAGFDNKQGNTLKEQEILGAFEQAVGHCRKELGVTFDVAWDEGYSTDLETAAHRALELFDGTTAPD